MKFSATGIFLLLLAGSAQAYNGRILEQEVTEQNEAFQRFWGEPLEWRFDELPSKGGVPDYRVPYSGFIYPDANGGTTYALRKYDQAFHGGRSRAAAYEQRDIAAGREQVTTTRRGGLFGMRTVTATSISTPYWHGHCNGWTAASIRHAAPERSVTRNGVVFSPAEIKGLLAELYVYNKSQYLGGYNGVINPALFHVVMANWIGRMSHPLGMEADPGKEVWNYPLYSYNTSFAKRNGGRQVEVKMTARWANSVNRESNDNVHNARDKYFHYLLNLDSEGRITGGYYYRGSQLDMLWVPLTPKQPGGEGNKRGNPYLNAEEVVSIWRDSISSDIVDKWVNIDVARPQVDETPDTDSQLAAADTSDAPTEAAAAEAVEEPAEAETVVDEAGAEDSEAAADSAAGEVEVTAAEVAS